MILIEKYDFYLQPGLNKIEKNVNLFNYLFFGNVTAFSGHHQGNGVHKVCKDTSFNILIYTGFK